MKITKAQRIKVISTLRTHLKVIVLLSIPLFSAAWNVDSIAREREWCQHVVTVDSQGFTDKVLFCKTFAFR